MELKKLKRINNAPKYAVGKEWSWNGNDDPAQGKVVDGFKDRIASNGGGVVTGLVNFVGSGIRSFGPVKTDTELMNESQRSVGSGSGFTYNKIANVDQQRQLSELASENTSNTLGSAATGAGFGAAVGSIFPGAGTIIGGAVGAVAGLGIGLLGGSSRKARLQKKILAANRRIESTNTYNLADAQSDYLTNQYNLDHDNTQDDVLYYAKRGKDLKRPIYVS